MEFTKVGAGSFIAIILGIVIAIVPIAIVLIWKIRKKEKFTTVLVGAAAFLLFALVIEKPIQALLIMPTSLGLPDHAASIFINSRPALWAFVVGLFPGVFEETGRFIAFKTVLRKRKNKETSISYGIGHGGFEAMYILGLTFVEYLVFAVMINTGSIDLIMSQLAATTTPDVVQANFDAINATSSITVGAVALMAFERIFAVLFHIGASIIVFYAARDKEKIWLYPLAILLHTVLDGIAGLSMVGVISISTWGLEAIVVVFGCAVFFGAFFLLYKKDRIDRIKAMESLYNSALELTEKADPAELKGGQAIISTLRQYYESPLWKKDFEADEKGLLPADLQRGVLSEDGLYNLLEKNKEILGD